MASFSKGICLQLLIVIVIGGYCLAQSEEKIELSPLKTPVLPAGTILGMSPNEIAQPKSYKALETALYSNFLDENNSLAIPNNYALEFNPYWMAYHENLSFDDYVNPKAMETMLRTLSISIASTQNFITNDSLAVSAIGLGIRSVLDFGKPSKKLDSLVKVFQTNSSIRLRVQEFITNITSDIRRKNINGVDSLKAYTIRETEKQTKDLSGMELEILRDALKTWSIEAVQFYENLDPTLDEAGKLQKLRDFIGGKRNELDIFIRKATNQGIKREKLKNVITDRYGWKIEFALATAITFPNGSVDYSEVPKWSFWVTPSYQHKNVPEFEFLGVARVAYLDVPDSLGVSSDSVSVSGVNSDLGLKVIFKKPKFSLNLEGLYRWEKFNVEKEISANTSEVTEINENDHQLILNATYNLSDNMVISYSFGRGFSISSTGEGDLISILSLAFGLGGPTTNDFKK